MGLLTVKLLQLNSCSCNCIDHPPREILPSKKLTVQTSQRLKNLMIYMLQIAQGETLSEIFEVENNCPRGSPTVRTLQFCKFITLWELNQINFMTMPKRDSYCKDFFLGRFLPRISRQRINLLRLSGGMLKPKFITYQRQFDLSG